MKSSTRKRLMTARFLGQTETTRLNAPIKYLFVSVCAAFRNFLFEYQELTGEEAKWLWHVCPFIILIPSPASFQFPARFKDLNYVSRNLKPKSLKFDVISTPKCLNVSPVARDQTDLAHLITVPPQNTPRSSTPSTVMLLTTIWQQYNHKKTHFNAKFYVWFISTFYICVLRLLHLLCCSIPSFFIQSHLLVRLFWRGERSSHHYRYINLHCNYFVYRPCFVAQTKRPKK